VIATCVAHQYSIVKDQRLLQKPGVGTLQGFDSWILEFWNSRNTEYEEWPQPTHSLYSRHPLYSTLAMRACLVGLGRVELPTSPLSGVRSSQLSYRPVGHWPSGTGGAGRDRTGDLLNANQALSQLSYSPCWGLEARDLGPGTTETVMPIPNPQSQTPNFVIEADWTLPAGAWPNRRNKSQNLSGDPRRIWTGKAITY
jgi:hypothetical protein